ncbi:MAG TPA: hypothetical protein VLA52_14210 [Thermohalobaculum sp.]|nr:hypothetical protein [Thermohalobaculum sp.]
MRYLIVFALAVLFAGPAAAKAMKVGDLGPMAGRKACMQQARAVLQDYIDEHGGQSITGGEEDDPAENWSVYGWGLRPGVNDVVIICPIVTTQPNAFYTIHSDGPEGVENADLVAGRIDELWRQPR